MTRPLTENQLTLLQHAAKGMSSKESAKKLGLSHWTVNTSRKFILKKMDSRNMVQAVAKAIRSGAL